MPPKNKIGDLYNHLFAKVIVEAAKVEVGLLKVTGALRGSDFLPTEVGNETQRALRAVNER